MQTSTKVDSLKVRGEYPQVRDVARSYLINSIKPKQQKQGILLKYYTL
jgi:hypothetical protein